MILCASIAFTSCYKANLQSADILGGGLVEITVPTPTLPDGAAAPDKYTAVVDNQVVTIEADGTITLPEKLSPGEHTVYVYNEVEGVSYDKSTSGEDIIASLAATNGVVESISEPLFFGTQIITVKSDSAIATEVVLKPITRELLFNLKIVDGDPTDIKSITASLNGVASQWSCRGDAPYGAPVSIVPTLTLGEPISRSETDLEYLTASLTMLGTNGAKQELSVVITYKDGTAIKHVSDVSKELASFNADKSSVMTLLGDIAIPKESSHNGTIENWEVVVEDEVVTLN